ncbi:MAG: hypothetical protein KGO96_07535 [Elusimicrobia bacterium]|nr:hypothetical protein [Elusimicrobiota bacterium]
MRKKRAPEPEYTILSLDISTKTGWALMSESGKLLEYGKIEISDYKDFPYPYRHVAIAKDLSSGVEEICTRFEPNKVIIEELNRWKTKIYPKAFEFSSY